MRLLILCIVRVDSKIGSVYSLGKGSMYNVHVYTSEIHRCISTAYIICEKRKSTGSGRLNASWGLLKIYFKV